MGSLLPLPVVLIQSIEFWFGMSIGFNIIFGTYIIKNSLKEE